MSTDNSAARCKVGKCTCVSGRITLYIIQYARPLYYTGTGEISIDNRYHDGYRLYPKNSVVNAREFFWSAEPEADIATIQLSCDYSIVEVYWVKCHINSVGDSFWGHIFKSFNNIARRTITIIDIPDANPLLD